MLKTNCTTCKHCGVKFDRKSLKFKRYCKIEDLFMYRLPNVESGKWQNFACHWHNNNISIVKRMLRNILAA